MLHDVQLWRRARLWTATTGMALVTLFGIVLPVLRGQVYVDFTVFWAAANSSTPYDVAALTALQDRIFGLSGPRPFVYPPTTLLLMKPFGALPFALAIALWGACGLAAFIHAARLVGNYRGLLALLSPAVTASLFSGQTSLFVGALTVTGLTLSGPIAGALLGAGAAIKPQLFLLLPLALVASRQWQTLAYAAATSSALATLTVMLWGFQPWIDWVLAVQQFPGILRDIGIETHGVTINALAITYGLPSWTFLVGVPLAVALVWLTFSRTESAVDRLVVLVCAAALASPYMLHYDLAALAVGASVLLFSRDRSLLTWVGAALSVTLVLASFGIILLSLGLVREIVMRRVRSRSPVQLAAAHS